MFNIPEEKLPQEFKDEARLDSLYSPFRSHSVNPRDWDTKISSWKHLIFLYCINNGIYSFTGNELNKSLMRNGRPPRCLRSVLEELIKSGDLQLLEDFVKQAPKSWGSWATDFLVKRPLLWSYNTVKKSFTNEINMEQTYVYIEVIRHEAENFMSVFSESCKNKAVVNFVEALNLIGKDLSGAEDFKLVLHYLVKENKANMKAIKNSKELKSLLIKISHQDKPIHISEVDIAVYVLEDNEKIFTKCVEDLENEIQDCIKEVKKQLLRGHSQLAKVHLKKKHKIQKQLTHKANALYNIQTLLTRIKDVRDDADVWQSYKQAVVAFNSTFKETGLTEEAIEDTMLKLKEMLEVQDDVQSTLAKSVASSDDEDLENELAELLRVEEKSENEGTQLDELNEQLAQIDLGNLPSTLLTRNISVPEIS